MNVLKIYLFNGNSKADKDNIVEAVKSGVSNYIVKPFNAATMKKKLIRSLLRNKILHFIKEGLYSYA